MIEKEEVIKAAQILRAGGLIAFPTDTVYGLGADAKNAAAMAKIYSVKNRPSTQALIVLIAEITQLKDWVSEITPTASLLAQHFWPGPLTLILPSINGTIGLRIPNHPVALALLKEFGSGIATTSANRSGEKSLLQIKQVQAKLGKEIDLVLAGECALAVESTIVDLTALQPKILRTGVISAEAINAALRK